jgi:predicted ATP-dependent endonuclease of OLD family
VRLASVGARNFRSLDDVVVSFREQVTVVIGENNGGKSTLLDAIRLLTDPLDGRRSRYWDVEDLTRARPSGTSTARPSCLAPTRSATPRRSPRHRRWASAAV